MLFHLYLYPLDVQHILGQWLVLWSHMSRAQM